MHLALDETCRLLTAELAGRSTAQIARHPAGDPARWSAHQVVEHLSTSWGLTIKGIEERLSKGRPLLTRPTLMQRFGQFAICTLGLFPSGRKAPPMTQPPAAPVPASGDELAARVTETLAAMDTLLTRIEATAHNRPVLTHIVLGPMNVQQWRSFHRVHACHHLKQIRAALAEG